MTPQAQSQQRALTTEEYAKQQQVGIMAAAHMQFLTCITCQPPPSKMPSDVRRYMWRQLNKTAALFRATAEEEPYYAEPE